MTNTRVIGAAISPFGRHMEKSLRDLSDEVTISCLADAGVDVSDVGVVFFANSLAGLLTGQESVRGQVALRNTGLMGKPIINVENACASSSTAFHLACTAIESGQHEMALVLGVEKMYHENKLAPIEALKACGDLDERDALVRRINGTVDGSLFMDLYAHLSKKYMAARGATVEDFARASVKNRRAGSLNPIAQFRKEVTVEEVLASRVISDPLTLMMCSSIGDGAAALLLCSEQWAKTHGKTSSRVRASVLVSGQGDDENALPGAQVASRMAYDKAGIAPSDLDVVEVHDASSPAEFWLSEQLGLTDNGLELFRSGATSIDGDIPINPSGGLVSRGHPIGATGAAQLVELHDQLLGRCGQRQVSSPRLALAENGGGWLGMDAAATVVTILSRD
jgi:acetyl-CoA acetyltransferase